MAGAEQGHPVVVAKTTHVRNHDAVVRCLLIVRQQTPALHPAQPQLRFQPRENGIIGHRPDEQNPAVGRVLIEQPGAAIDEIGRHSRRHQEHLRDAAIGAGQGVRAHDARALVTQGFQPQRLAEVAIGEQRHVHHAVFQQSPVQPRPHQRGAAQVTSGQVGYVQTGGVEARPAQVGVGQVRHGEIGFGEIGAGQVRAGQSGEGKVAVGEISAPQIGAAEVAAL